MALARHNLLAIAPLALALADLARRLLGPLPHDLSAYVAAAQTAARGADPYSNAILQAPAYQGYPYGYPPWTLPLLRPLASLPPQLWAVGDWALRVAIVWAGLGWMRRELQLRPALPLLATGAMLFTPLYTDTLAANLALMQLGAFLLLARASTRPPGWRDLGTGAAACLVGAVKPSYLLASASLALGRGRGRLLAGMALGGGLVATLQWVERASLPAWWHRLQAMIQFWPGVDLRQLAWFAWLGAALLWAVVALVLGRRRPHRLWLWCAASACAWPRLQSYDLLMLGPGLLYLTGQLRRRDWLLLAAPMVTPLPVLLGQLLAPWVSRALFTSWLLLLCAVLGWRLTAAGHGTAADDGRPAPGGQKKRRAVSPALRRDALLALGRLPH